MRCVAALLFALLPTLALADGLIVKDAFVPAAPPNAMAHAAYMTLTNDGDTELSLIGVTAQGYMMAHLHQSAETDGIATMSAVDVIGIEPGASVTFERGGLHFMLMKPMAPIDIGQIVTLTLEFDDGTTQAVEAEVLPFNHGS